MKSKIDLVKAWLKKAENDLIAAENSVKIKLYDIASFHAQQCAEKYLKAFLTYHEIEFEKTHAIEDLLLPKCSVLPTLCIPSEHHTPFRHKEE